MVATAAYQAPVTWDAPSKQQSFSWVSVPVQSVFEAGLRMEASVYATEAQIARQLITQCKYGCVPLYGESGLLKYAFNPARFKRIYLSKLSENSVGFLGSAEMLELEPRVLKYLPKHQCEKLNLLVEKEQILISCSGTIGNLTIVTDTLSKYAISQHVIRMIAKEYPGYIYIFLKSKTGQTIIKSNNYGAVIQHIEPSHLVNIPVPNASKLLQLHIHHAVTESFNLRDESNALIEQARAKLQTALKLPAVEDLNPSANGDNGLRSFSVNVADLNQRLEANYHNPLAQAITQHLQQHAAQVLALGDKQITEKIILAGRFKRVYVDEQQGIPFLGGKEILELDPRGEKYLSLKHHGERIAEQLTLDENMILITCSGTIGKANIVPKHWQGWAGSQHILRAVPASTEWAGYLYAWLSSEWALPLIRRHTYGAVVFEIDQYQLAEVPVPLLADVALMHEINTLILRANELRYTAFTKGQEALRLFNEDVLGLPSTTID
jgi:type I restriction enzyme, S subunit